jgi:hypothetical protein
MGDDKRSTLTDIIRTFRDEQSDDKPYNTKISTLYKKKLENFMKDKHDINIAIPPWYRYVPITNSFRKKMYVGFGLNPNYQSDDDEDNSD